MNYNPQLKIINVKREDYGYINYFLSDKFERNQKKSERKEEISEFITGVPLEITSTINQLIQL